MTADSQWPVQKAVYSALVNDSALAGLMGSPPDIYDNPPPNSDFPYVLIGESTAVDSDTKTTDGMEQTLTIHSWSRYRGQREVKLIMAAIVDALDDQALAVTGHTLINLRFEFSDTFKDPDGLTRHGVQRFRVVTQA